MKVLIFPADKGGCGHYRMIWPAQAVAANSDLEIEIRDPDNEDDPWIRATVHDLESETKVVSVAPIDADVVVLQRPLRRMLAQTISFIQAQGVAVVVELDDDFSSVPRRNAAWKDLQGEDRNNRWLEQACKQADLVTVTSSALCRRYGFGHGWRIPNLVPRSYLEIDVWKESKRPCIGWSGSIESHPNDLQQVGGAIAKMVSMKQADFRVVGTGKGVAQHLGLPPDYNMVATNWVSIDQYPREMAANDVGIVPLEDNRFNHAKSWLKGLEFASLGVPFVASPTAEYCQLYIYEIGLLAEDRKWTKPLRQLTFDPKGEGERMRHNVRANGLTYEDRWHMWERAWKEAANNRVKRMVHRG